MVVGLSFTPRTANSGCVWGEGQANDHTLLFNINANSKGLGCQGPADVQKAKFSLDLTDGAINGEEGPNFALFETVLCERDLEEAWPLLSVQVRIEGGERDQIGHRSTGF